MHLYTAKARAVCCQLRHLLRGTLELRARKRTCPGTQVLTGGQTYHRIQSKQVSDTALAAQLQDCYHVASCTPTPQQKGCFFYQVYPVYLICLVKKMRRLRTEMKSGVGRIKNCHPGTRSLRRKYFRTILRHGATPKKATYNSSRHSFTTIDFIVFSNEQFEPSYFLRQRRRVGRVRV